MAEDHIRYDILTQDALRGVVRKVLQEINQTGLPGEHHFFISFDTRFPGVRLSTRMLEQYPEEMTIVLQHQFWDLKVGENGFEVGLSFSDIPERLVVPYASIKGFFDPSVQFGLEFDVDRENVAEVDDTLTALPPSASREQTPRPALVGEAEKEQDDKAPNSVKDSAPDPDEVKNSDKTPEKDGDAEETDKSARVVSLDAFRKKT